jgi:hypothetical protein
MNLSLKAPGFNLKCVVILGFKVCLLFKCILYHRYVAGAFSQWAVAAENKARARRLLARVVGLYLYKLNPVDPSIA